MRVRRLMASAMLGLVVASASPASGAMPQSPPPQFAGGRTIDATGDVFRGEAVFFQRCSLCHLNLSKAGLIPGAGPSMNGVLRDASPERETRVREQIRTGSRGMPGFQYGLTPRQLDQLIAYLKTLK